MVVPVPTVWFWFVFTFDCGIGWVCGGCAYADVSIYRNETQKYSLEQFKIFFFMLSPCFSLSMSKN